LRNIAEQISVIEENRSIDALKLKQYLPNLSSSSLPMIIDENSHSFGEEKSSLLKMIYDLRTELNELKKVTLNIMHGSKVKESEAFLETSTTKALAPSSSITSNNASMVSFHNDDDDIHEEEDDEEYYIETVEEDENLSLQDKEIEMIKKSLERNSNKRKLAAKELGISERTLYRKIKQYNL
jgi:DNA-binding NtrC family response regulator